MTDQVSQSVFTQMANLASTQQYSLMQLKVKAVIALSAYDVQSLIDQVRSANTMFEFQNIMHCAHHTLVDSGKLEGSRFLNYETTRVEPEPASESPVSPLPVSEDPGIKQKFMRLFVGFQKGPQAG